MSLLGILFSKTKRTHLQESLEEYGAWGTNTLLKNASDKI